VGNYANKLISQSHYQIKTRHAKGNINKQHKRIEEKELKLKSSASRQVVKRSYLGTRSVGAAGMLRS